jgi:hypothetical protein
MPVIRVNLIFQGAFQGWTETYFCLSAATPDAAVNAAVVANGLCDKRAELLAVPNNLIGVRASDDEINRDSIVRLFNLPYRGAWTGSAPVFNTLTCRMEATSLFRRSIYLRGIPSEIVSPTNGGYVATPAWSTSFNNWRNLLLNPNFIWGLKRLDKTAPKTTIIGGTRQVDVNSWQFTVAAVAGFNPGDIIRIRGGSRGNDLKGFWTITAVDLVNITARATIYKRGPVTAGTTMQKVSYLTTGFSAITAEFINHRDTGRFLFQHRGRSRARAAS